MKLLSRFMSITVMIIGLVNQAQACPKDGKPMTSAQDVLQCVLENHPELKRAQVKVTQSEYVEGVARQIPNPELSTKAVTGQVAGEKQWSTETSLVQIFELGGKRSARVDKAQATKLLAQSDLALSQEEVAIETVLNLYRLRQLTDERKILEDSLAAYSKILGQIRQRPKLTPDLEVSQEIFRLAEADFKLKSSIIASDVISIRKLLELNLEGSLPPGESVLPGARNEWPVPTRGRTEIKSAALRKSMAEKKLAEAEFEAAKGEAWPDLKLGPDVETDSTDNSQKWGLTLSLPLPLFHLNGAGKSYAQHGLQAAELNLEQTKSRSENQRSQLLSKYEVQVETLKASQSLLESSVKKKKRIEDLYGRGLITSAQLIESQRQLLEYVKSRNETELNTIETLWRIHAMDGRVLEEKL